ncbi:Putative RarD protein [Mycobacteroides abscessus subsp. abscessus]|nr:Putative RarD protein [Mycobacteroides abscessus subsp. abscessus]
MPPERWVGFVLIWAALVIFTADTVRSALILPRQSGRPATVSPIDMVSVKGRD